MYQRHRGRKTPLLTFSLLLTPPAEGTYAELPPHLCHDHVGLVLVICTSFGLVLDEQVLKMSWEILWSSHTVEVLLLVLKQASLVLKSQKAVFFEHMVGHVCQ